jgi:hypothetical protein
MGFYLRKSLTAGPFRFNLSKSGIGVSTGIPGFRVGSGPRGNYVSMGSHGLHYRATLGGTKPRGQISPASSPSTRPVAQFSLGGAVQMADVTGADVRSLEPTGGGDLVEQLNAAATRFGFAIPTAVVLFVVSLFFMPWGLILWAVAVPAVWWVALRDKSKKSVVVFYDVNDAQADWYQQMVDAATHLSAAQGLWRVVQAGLTANPYQRKVNAGAGVVLRRIAAKAHLIGPKILITNVAVPTVVAGKLSIHFLPDRVLVRDQKRFTDIAYAAIGVSASSTRFIESSIPVPRDAQQVGTTWQYVNKSGGPDRRFKNNRQLPIMKYEELVLASSSGFRWDLQASLVPALEQMASVLTAKNKMLAS